MTCPPTPGREGLRVTASAGPPGIEVAHGATWRELAAQGLPLDREDLDELEQTVSVRSKARCLGRVARPQLLELRSEAAVLVLERARAGSMILLVGHALAELHEHRGAVGTGPGDSGLGGQVLDREGSLAAEGCPCEQPTGGLSQGVVGRGQL
jgi:hypothetical protein